LLYKSHDWDEAILCCIKYILNLQLKFKIYASYILKLYLVTVHNSMLYHRLHWQWHIRILLLIPTQKKYILFNVLILTILSQYDIKYQHITFLFFNTKTRNISNFTCCQGVSNGTFIFIKDAQHIRQLLYKTVMEQLNIIGT
jgi:hypothetical protein